MAAKRAASDMNADLSPTMKKKQKVDIEETTGADEVTSTKVAGITELLEMILLDLDMKSLLLAQRVSKKFQGVINANTNIQKKLFFIQPTFDEAMELGLIGENTTVSTFCPNDVCLLNPLLLKIRLGQDARQEGRLPKSILRDTISARRGKSSWERMYGRTLIRNGTGPLGIDNDFVLEVVIDVKMANFGLRYYKVEDRIEIESAWVWDEKPMRGVMDEAEEDALEQDGLMFRWSEAKFQVCGRAMSYGLWKKCEQFARLEEIDCWDDLAGFLGYWYFEAKEIEKALDLRAMEEENTSSEEDESEGH